MPIKLFQYFMVTKPWQGVLLYGPPGIGKSLFGKALAGEGQFAFFLINCSELISKLPDEIPIYLKEIFSLANKSQPSIIFLDDLDSLAINQSEMVFPGLQERIFAARNEFFIHVRNQENEDVAQVFLLGATNAPWLLDSALRQRFEKGVYLGLPDLETRKLMIKSLLSRFAHSITDKDTVDLANKTNG